jgi:hypothetical protein
MRLQWMKMRVRACREEHMDMRLVVLTRRGLVMEEERLSCAWDMMAGTELDADSTLKTVDIQEVPHCLEALHVAQCVRPAPRLPRTNPS